AAKYYHEGLVTRVLVTEARESPSEKLGIIPTHKSLNISELTRLGVPETAIESVGMNLSNTYEEAVALREWVERKRASRLIVPTEDFSTRRVRWVLGHVLAGTGTQIQVPALKPFGYTRTDWWKSDLGFMAFQNEVLKYCYYRIRY